VFDTATCTCCESLKHERLVGEFSTLKDAVDSIVGTNDLVIRCGARGWTASEGLREMGYTAQKLAEMAEAKRLATLKWLNLPDPLNLSCCSR